MQCLMLLPIRTEDYNYHLGTVCSKANFMVFFLVLWDGNKKKYTS